MTCNENDGIELEAVVTCVEVVGGLIDDEAEVTLGALCMVLKRQ